MILDRGVKPDDVKPDRIARTRSLSPGECYIFSVTVYEAVSSLVMMSGAPKEVT